MNCEAFARWLDDDCPAAEDAAARAHALVCARCAAALDAAEEIGERLARFSTPAPDAFTDRVMARVAAVEEARVTTAPLTSPLDWWVRAAFDPAAALALLLAGLMAWRGEVLWRLAAPVTLGVLDQASRIGLPRFPLLERPGVPLALALAAAPFLLWASWRLFVLAERACVAGVARGRLR